MSADSRLRRLTAAFVRVAPLGFPFFIQATWFHGVISNDEPMAAVRRDWLIFRETGRRLLAGQFDAFYPGTIDPGYFWLYPPYCIYLTAPLGVLGEAAAYAVCFGVEVVAVIAALALLRATIPAPRVDHWKAAAVVLASMPFNTTIVMGQVSGILVLLLALALHAWVRERGFVAGLFTALVFIKPNIAAFITIAAIVTRQWKVVAGTMVGLLALFTATIPLGLARWTDYVVTTRQYVDVIQKGTPFWKQVTLYAFWRTVPGLSSGAASGLWVTSVALLMTLAAIAAWRTGATLPEDRARVFALAVLLGLALNVYAYFYDALLLAVPGTVWYVRRREYHRFARVAIAVCVAALFVDGYIGVLVISGGVSWAGAFITLWAIVEVVDLLARARVRAPADGVLAPQPAAASA